MPFDISLVPDSEMRPWADTKETDEKVDQELRKVNDILNFTSPVKNGGFAGMSELDGVTDEVRVFKDMVEDPGWIGFEPLEPEFEEGAEDGSLMDDSIDSLEGQYLDEAMNVNEGVDNLPIRDQNLLDDPTVLQAMNKLNNLTVKMSRTRLARLRTMHLLPIETMRKQKEKKKLASVKHNPHYSLSPGIKQPLISIQLIFILQST